MKGILFKSGMIKAIVAGKKTQTRRVIKLRGKAYKFMRERGYNSIQYDEVIYPDGGGNWIGWDKDSPGLAEFTKKAYPNGEGFKSLYQVGETAYIKEVHKLRMSGGLDFWECQYKDGDIDTCNCAVDPHTPDEYLEFSNKWRSPLFMAAWAARYFIKIIGVRPERLQEITEEDAFAEGCSPQDTLAYQMQAYPSWNAKLRYAELWNSINKPPYDWASNPWVWVYTFKLEAKIPIVLDGVQTIF